MQIARNFEDLKKIRSEMDGKLAFVPTMGALHAGHLALVECAGELAENVAVSIFVNPTQFGAGEDFERYPRDYDSDIAKLAKLVNVVYLPSVDDIYPDGAKVHLKAGREAEGLEGAHRPGHFDGVVSVVGRLFKQVQPDVAVFGEKDYQQLMVIKEMNFEPEIIGVPTLREAGGLAMSSRNVYLSDAEREIAPNLYEVISSGKTTQEMQDELENAGFKVEYVAERWGRILVAVKLGNTRLIDNVPLKS